MIWKIWKKSKLNSENILKIKKKVVKRIGKYRKKLSWIDKRQGKYGRKVSWKVKRYVKYGRNPSWIVIRFGKYWRILWNIKEKME
jgi:hypothetical protein